jgi:hypothetical protein
MANNNWNSVGCNPTFAAVASEIRAICICGDARIHAAETWCCMSLNVWSEDLARALQ